MASRAARANMLSVLLPGLHLGIAVLVLIGLSRTAIAYFTSQAIIFAAWLASSFVQVWKALPAEPSPAFVDAVNGAVGYAPALSGKPVLFVLVT